MIRKIFSLILLSQLIASTAFAADTSITSDKLKLGIPTNSTADKTIEANKGAGALNPKIKWNGSTSTWQYSNDGTNYSDIGSGSGGGSGYNALKNSNPEFESALTGWTNFGAGTFSAVSFGSNLLFDKGSASFQASAAGQYFESAAVAVPPGLYGKTCSVGIFQKGGDSNLKLEAYDGTGTLIAGSTIVLQAQTLTTPVYQIFQCPTSGSFKLRVTSTAASAIAYFDRASLGEPGTYQFAQAQSVGTSTWAQGVNFWQIASGTTSFQSFAVNASIPAPTLTGSLTAPATRLPQVVIPSAGPGTYYVVANGAFAGNSVGVVTYFSISDGTNNSGDNAIGSANNSNTGSTVTGTFTYANQQSNLTFSVVGRQAAAGHQILIGQGETANDTLVIQVFYFPSQTQTAYRADQTPASYAASFTSTGCTTTATSASDITNCSAPALTPRGTSRNLSCSVASGQLGITCNIPRPGNYLVLGGAEVTSSLASATYGVQLTDGLNNIIDASVQASIHDATFSQAVHFSGVYTAASAGSVTFKLRGYINSGTLNFNSNNPEFQVVELDAPFSMPFVLNQFTSSNSNGERTERVMFGDSGGTLTSPTVCASSTCTVYSTTNSGITVTRSSTGVYVVSFPAGLWSTAPTCTFSIVSVGNMGSAIYNGPPSATSLTLLSRTTSNTNQDAAMGVICEGPK